MQRRHSVGKGRPGKIRKPAKTEEQLVAEKAASIGVPQAQIDRGWYAIVDVKLEMGEKVETNRTVRVKRTLVERWFAEGGPGFNEPQARAVTWVQGLWAAAGHAGPVMSAWGEYRGGSNGTGLRQYDALTELSRLKAKFPPHVWNAFEDVCRSDIAAGEAGSQLTTAKRSAHENARACVGFVASMIAQWRGM